MPSTLVTSRLRSQQIFEQLRSEIVTVQRRPGEALQKEEIAAAMGVSRMPVGEALARLAAIGLVTVIPQVGSFVSRLSVIDLLDSVFLRRAAEMEIARRLAHSPSAETIEALERNLAEQKRLVNADDWKAFHQVDSAMHQMMAGLAGVPGVWEQIAQARLHLERLRYLALPVPGRMEETYDEHAAIIDAVRRRNPKDAAQGIIDHLANADPYLERFRTLYPDYFID